MAIFPLPSNDPLAPTPSLGSGDLLSVNITKTSFENNTLAVRRLSTRSRKSFSLTYPAITLAEFQILETHFINNVGTTFLFVHPVEDVEYNVTYSKGELEKTYISSNVVSTGIQLESI
jgi:hypothetical protein